MNWQTILGQCRRIKEQFDKSYKCLNTDRATTDGTVHKHLQNLFLRLEEIRVLLNVHYNRLTEAHKNAAEAFFSDVRGRLINVATRRGIEVTLPDTLHTKIEIPAILEGQDINMTQTVVEFLKTAASLIPDFDGKVENLTSFIDALELVNSIKESHEAIAVSLVKTKLKGSARNLISNEDSLTRIIDTLKNSVKGESVEVITAKLLNLKQKNKTANQYTKEVDELTKALEGAYISDGLTNNLASRYSTQQAVRAMSRNCSIEKVKLIMEAGNFATMNEAISKFINSCTESTGNEHTVLHYKQRGGGNYRGGQYRRNRGRYGNYTNHDDRRDYGDRRQANHGNQYRGRGNRYNGNNNRRTDSNRNVRVTHSENDQTPLSNQE